MPPACCEPHYSDARNVVFCTKPAGHLGQHEAMDIHGDVLKRWDA